MKHRLQLLVLLALVVVLPAFAAPATEVPEVTLALKGGSILKGKVVSHDAEAVIFDLGFAAVRIPLSEVVGLVATPDTNNAAAQPNNSPAQPHQALPRPRLAQVRPGILQERPVGVNNVGQIGVDAHFSQFGDYLQELIDIVQIQWERILTQGSNYPKPSSHVTIAFRLNSQGKIAEILKVDGDAGETGNNAALSAIRENVPYRPWTKEMVSVLGDSQVVTFSFYYW